MLFLISTAAWSLLLTVFVGFSFLTALLIGSILSLLTAGFLNSLITNFLWFDVSNGFWKLLTHGIALFFVLFVLDSILITVPTLTFPGSATTAITFAVGTIANGLMTKGIAVQWGQENGGGVSDMNEAERSQCVGDAGKWNF